MNRTALVTGAASGIGREVAKQLAARDWRILAVDLSGEKLKDMGKKWPGLVRTYEADLTAQGAPEEIIAVCKKEFGGLDLLANVAGVSWVGDFADIPLEKLDRIINVNVRSLMLMCRAAIPVLEASDNAQIINVASLAAHIPMETLAVYCASKAAVQMFSRVLSKELAPKGIRVNIFSPFGTNTAIFDGSDIDRSLLMPPEDVAKMVVMLTELPQSLDLDEIRPHKRLSPL